MQEKILLFGEGPTDYGIKEHSTGKWKHGPIQPIVRKTAGRPVAFEHVEKNEVKKLRIQRGPKSGHAVKSYKLCVIAGKKRLDKIICYVDADRIPGKRKKEVLTRVSFFSVYEEIQKGFEAFNEKFSRSHNKKIIGIPMVPLPMIESWLLSDEAAFIKCFGKPPSNPRLPAKPELTWGEKENPDSNYPKNLMKRVLNQYKGVVCGRGDLDPTLTKNPFVSR
jgi:hypothetical protein